MTKLEFEKNFGISRGQMNRLVEKAFGNGGKFLLPGHGEFQVRKGPAKNAKIEITAVKSEAIRRGRPAKSEPAALPDIVAEARDRIGRPVLEDLDAEDLNREKKIAEIRKLWQQTDDGKDEIRAEFRSEVIAAFGNLILHLKSALETMDLSEDQKSKFRSAAEEALAAMEEM